MPRTSCEAARVTNCTLDKHSSQHRLQTIPLTWPFVVWGLDMVEPLRKAPGGFMHLLVAIDKFSKWIKV
jgi:hypothetical protein